jgi:hypothetical protein
VIHVKNTEEIENLIKACAITLDVLVGRRILRDQRSNDGKDRKKNEKKDRQL